jgi:hypothetical protein
MSISHVDLPPDVTYPQHFTPMRLTKVSSKGQSSVIRADNSLQNAQSRWAVLQQKGGPPAAMKRLGIGDQKILRIEFAARAKAATDVVLDIVTATTEAVWQMTGSRIALPQNFEVTLAMPCGLALKYHGQRALSAVHEWHSFAANRILRTDYLRSGGRLSVRNVIIRLQATPLPANEPVMIVPTYRCVAARNGPFNTSVSERKLDLTSDLFAMPSLRSGPFLDSKWCIMPEVSAMRSLTTQRACRSLLRPKARP